MHFASYRFFHTFLIFLLFGIMLTSQSNAAEIKIGVRAHSGIDKAIIKWKPTADYLSRIIPEHTFVIIPYIKLSEYTNAVNQGEVDFIVTNPSSYIEMEVLAGASRILTLVNKRQGNAYTKFGSVIFTRFDRDDIKQLSDLKHKSFMAVSKKAFGGWQVPLYEFHKNGIFPGSDFSKLSFGQGIQESVVYAVRDGLVDAGSVRTDMLERMDANGEININDFKVIGKKTTENFPFRHSTQLYPEWVFAKSRHVSDKITNKVLIALLQIKADDPAAIAGHYMGWTAPLHYNKVHEILRKLKVAPYNTAESIDYIILIREYWFELISVVVLLLALTLLLIIKIKSNRRYMQLSQELQQYKKNLEQEVHERTLELEQRNQELEAYSYTMAHDLRTPLRGIISFSQILQEESTDNLTEEARGFLKRIIFAGKHMEVLISDILELARISRTTLDITSVNLSDIGNHIKYKLTSSDIQRKFEWTIHPDLECKGDLKLIDKLIFQLLENAWKYSTNTDISIVEFGCEKQSGEDVFFVKDNGAGFDMKYSKTLFKPFYRLHNIEEYEGTGIGLAIAHRVVEQHGGRIWAESTPEKGTSIYFTLRKHM